jgi:hypothetical protein
MATSTPSAMAVVDPAQALRANVFRILEQIKQTQALVRGIPEFANDYLARGTQTVKEQLTEYQERARDTELKRRSEAVEEAVAPLRREIERLRPFESLQKENEELRARNMYLEFQFEDVQRREGRRED